MRVVVIGGTGLVGSQVVRLLAEHGHDAVAASPATGVNTLTGEGVAEALADADVVVDASNSPSFEESVAVPFFETSTRTLLDAEVAAGVGHHVALSVVGTEELSAQSGYFRAKLAQERLITGGPVPYSIVHATQFFEFLGGIADEATDGDTVRLSHANIQPIASADVAAAVARIAVGAPVAGIREIGGPQRFPLDELFSSRLTESPRTVVTDPEARYFGVRLGDDTLTPGPDAALAETTLADWTARHVLSRD